jgi:hypothetical protein
MAVRSGQIGTYPALDAVAVGNKLGESDGSGFILPSVLIEVGDRCLDRGCNRQRSRPREDEPVVLPRQRVIKAAVILRRAGRKAISRATEDDGA